MLTDRTVFAAIMAAFVFGSPPGDAAPPDDNPSEKTEAASPARNDEIVRDVLDAHNRERAKEKLGPLTLDSKLTAAAQAHADDMASHHKMTHDGSDGSTASDRVKKQGYRFQSVAENVAEGYRTADAVMNGWMHSEHHRENILGKYTQVGIALARDDKSDPYWCVDFATPWTKLDPAVASADLIKAINAERTTAGLPPLKAREKLSTAATRIVRQFATADSLNPKDRGDDLVTILRRLGYPFRTLAETAASGQPGPAEVLKSWMDQPAQREPLLGDFTEIGVGYSVAASGKPYWFLVLARPLPQQ